MGTRIIGHRGAAAVEPENTLCSLAKGLECGADLVEIDVRRSRDGHLVVIHDRTLERTTNGAGLVSDYTLKELKNLDAGKGERIPTLREVLEFIMDAKAKLIIEIKEVGTEQAIAQEVRSAGLQESVILVSFNPRSVWRAKGLLPTAATGLIFSKPLRNPIGLAMSIRTNIILPKFDLVTMELLNSAHRHGLKLFSWTLNTKEEFKRAVELGLDAFATDNPCFAKKVSEQTLRA